MLSTSDRAQFWRNLKDYSGAFDLEQELSGTRHADEAAAGKMCCFLLLIYASNNPPILATPVIIEDGKADNDTYNTDDDEGHEDTAATANKTMASPKATTKTPATDPAAAKKKTAGPKTTGETNADYSTTTPAVRVVSKIDIRPLHPR